MPPITKNLIIINVLCFLGTLVAARYGVALSHVLGLHFFLASDFHFYQLLSYLFMHADITHLLLNMFSLWMFGRVIESVWGPRRFLLFYMVCGIGAGLMQELVQFIAYSFDGMAAYDNVSLSGGVVMPMAEFLNNWRTVGASGAVYGILLAFGMTFPEERIFIFPLPVPIKAKYFVMGYAALELFYAWSSPGDGVAHMAHLGGMLFGWLLIRHWRRNERGGNPWGGGGGYSENIFTRFFRQFTAARRPHMEVHMGKRQADFDFNARRKARNEEIDRILDKVKQSGYASLSEDEKRKLFDASER